MDNAALSFKIGPVPIVIRPSVVVMLTIFGFLLESTSVEKIALWTAIGVASILWHELGHAVAALILGGKPKVVLAGLGGATDPGIGHRPGRASSAFLALAGPLFGFAVGAVLWFGTDPDFHALFNDTSLLDFGIATALWMNIGWGVLNLLPVLPLDGGRLLTEIIPGDVSTRNRRALLASVVFGAGLAVTLMAINQPFAGVLFGMLATQAFFAWRALRTKDAIERRQTNLATLIHAMGQGDRGAEAQLRAKLDDPIDGPTVRTLLINELIRSGRGEEAKDLTTAPGINSPTAPFLVEVMQSGGETGVESLIESFRRAPSVQATQHLVLGLNTAGKADMLSTVVDGSDVPPEIVAIAQHHAHRLKAYEAAVELGSVFYKKAPDANGLAAFNVACSLAKRGDDDSAVQWLGAAIERGLPDLAALDTDEDLDSLRKHQGFIDLRRKAFGF